MKVPAVDDLSRNDRPLIDVALVAVVQLGVGADLGGAEQGSYGLGAVGALVVLSIESIVTYNLEIFIITMRANYFKLTNFFCC